MNIKAYEDLTGFAPANRRYHAVDTDTYDLTEDSSDVEKAVGYGPTPEAAIADLKEQLAELEQ